MSVNSPRCIGTTFITLNFIFMGGNGKRQTREEYKGWSSVVSGCITREEEEGRSSTALSAERGDERSQLVSDRGEKFIRNRAFR